LENRSAVAAPIPRELPVIIAVLASLILSKFLKKIPLPFFSDFQNDQRKNERRRPGSVFLSQTLINGWSTMLFGEKMIDYHPFNRYYHFCCVYERSIIF
jgi:hypothetical protein